MRQIIYNAGMENLEKQVHDKARLENVPIMMDDGMEFLIDYITTHTDIKDILEIGTAVGYSSMRMAQVRWDNEIDTLEVNENMYTQAVDNIHKAGLQDRIHVHLIDGAQFETNKIYDLIFVDAAKSQYRRYLEHFYKNSRKGTVFIFDNLNFHGMVDNTKTTNNRSTRQMVQKIHKFRDFLLQDERFDTVFHSDVGDGVAVSVRKYNEE